MGERDYVSWSLPLQEPHSSRTRWRWREGYCCPTTSLLRGGPGHILSACTYTCFNERDEKEGRKKQARSNKNKAKQHSTPKAVTFPKKNELPRVGLEPTTLYTLDRALHMYMDFHMFSTLHTMIVTTFIFSMCVCVCVCSVGKLRLCRSSRWWREREM